VKNVLITDHNGYIGPHMVEILKAAGAYKVFGCDVNLFKITMIAVQLEGRFGSVESI